VRWVPEGLGLAMLVASCRSPTDVGVQFVDIAGDFDGDGARALAGWGVAGCGEVAADHTLRCEITPAA